MTINTNIMGWIRLSALAMGAGYLWRSSLRPNLTEPHKSSDRTLRLIGAILLSILTIGFLGYGLGLYAPR